MFQLIHTLHNFLDNSTKIIEWINTWFYTEYPFLIEKTQKRFKQYLNALNERLKRGRGVALARLSSAMCRNIMGTEKVSVFDGYELTVYLSLISLDIQATLLLSATAFDMKKFISKSTLTKIKNNLTKANFFVCKNCGNKYDYTDNFCTNCGNPLPFSKTNRNFNSI